MNSWYNYKNINQKGRDSMEDLEILHQVINKMNHFIPGFEPRKEQIQMMESVFQAMNEDKKAAIHAPTGTGKSLAYILPFVAKKIIDPDFRMTISTYTISLQEQLKKELELANSLYVSVKKDLQLEKQPFRWNINKGKSNYFCYHRFLESENMIPKTLFEKVENQFQALSINESRLDKQNFNLTIRSDQWDEMNVNTCKQDSCPYKKDCTFYKDYFSPADLVIVNHSLFFARHFFVDGSWDYFQFHIFDEAHKLEKEILNSSTQDLSLRKVEFWVFQAVNIANKHGIDDERINEWARSQFYEHQVISVFRSGLEKLAVRINEPSIAFEKTNVPLSNIKKMFLTIQKWQKIMHETFLKQVVQYESLDLDSSLKEEVDVWGKNLLELNEFLSVLEKEHSLFWLEKTNNSVSFKVTPKRIDTIPTPFTKGTAFTSGTLAQNNSCLSFAKRLNVDLDIDLALSTPFSLNEQTLAYISKTTNPKSSDYLTQLEKEIFELITKGDMKTFVLFTAEEPMKKMYEKLKKPLEDYAKIHYGEIDIWLQDPTNYKKVVSSFKELDKRSVLFGTLTYFEGIDLKEESLTQVILTRLPFSVPTHPVQEILDQEYQYSKWEATIRFEQAFGRLIRSTNDYGSFAVLDNRILRFKAFLDVFTQEGVPITHSLDDIEDFHIKKKN